MVIKKLNSETINLISAGEVIECPADITKELIENAIDAGAESITLTIKNAGIDLIEIKDNGCGIAKDELELCLERHTTSKLEKIDDLYSLDTFGFRGEALASINAVSRLKITSSNNEQGIGYQFYENKIQETPFNRGTTIAVKDLFYNVPVRKKFMHSNSTEFSKLYNTFLDFAILNPDIKFQFISEKKKEVFSKTTREGRYLQIFGKDILFKTMPVDINNQSFKLFGVICKPTNYFYYPINFMYINRRPIYAPKINKIIADCYKDYLMIQQKPFFVLFFEIDPKNTDVNIHPKKRSIKIQNEFVFLNQIKEELKKIFYTTEKKEIHTTPILNYSFSKNTSYLHESTKQNPNYVLSTQFTIIPTNPAPLKISNYSIKKILGQILDTYIVCELNDGMLLIDQHAAEERINLEKNRHLFLNEVIIQNLISPHSLDNIDKKTKEQIFQYQDKLSKLGFNIIEKNKKLLLTTIPVFLENYFESKLFLEILKCVDDSPEDSLLKIKEKILKLKACKESIKANEPLQLNQIIELIKKLNSCEDKTICAHGRPTTILISKVQLEKLFKRIPN